MRISEMLNAIASWLESSDNEAMLLAEYDNDCLKVVAESCVEAAFLLKKAADTVDKLEPATESNITPENLDGLARIATVFDASGDEELKKQASVIDELLLTIAAPPNAFAERKDLLDNRTEVIKKLYEEPRKELEKNNKIADSEKAISKSPMMKEYRILEAPLSTRTCPDHPGSQLARVGQWQFQCELDKKVYDYQNGYTLNDGTKVPGGDVANQTQGIGLPTQSLFDDREGRLQANKV